MRGVGHPASMGELGHFRGCGHAALGSGSGVGGHEGGNWSGIARPGSGQRDRLGDHLLAIVEGVFLLVNILVVPVNNYEPTVRADIRRGNRSYRKGCVYYESKRRSYHAACLYHHAAKGGMWEATA